MIIVHYSRRPRGVAIFSQRPKSLAVRTFIGETTGRIRATPEYLIWDKDTIFWCEDFRRSRKYKTVRLLFGAVGKHESIAMVERFSRTMKDEFARKVLVSLRREAFRSEFTSYNAWHEELLWF